MTTPQNEPEKGATMRFGDLRRMMQDMITAAVGDNRNDPPQRQPLRGGQPPQRSTGRSVDDEVRAAVEKLEKDRTAREERERKDKEYTDKLAALEERTKEKPPVERRRVHRLMGWGE